MTLFKKLTALLVIMLPSCAFAQVGIYVNPTNIDRQTVLDTGINHDYALFQSDLQKYADTSSTGKYVNLTTDQTGILGNKTFVANLTAANLYAQSATFSGSNGGQIHHSYFNVEGFTNYSDLPPSQGGYSGSFHLTNTGGLDFQDYFTFSTSGVLKVIIGGYGAGNGIPLVTYGESANVNQANQNNGVFVFPDHIERRTGYDINGQGGQTANALFAGDSGTSSGGSGFYVDLTTNQSAIGGNKTFTGRVLSHILGDTDPNNNTDLYMSGDTLASNGETIIKMGQAGNGNLELLDRNNSPLMDFPGNYPTFYHDVTVKGNMSANGYYFAQGSNTGFILNGSTIFISGANGFSTPTLSVGLGNNSIGVSSAGITRTVVEGPVTSVQNQAVFTDAYNNVVWTNMIITADGKHIQKSPGGNWFYTHPSDSGTYVADPVTVSIDSYGNATITY